MALIALVIGSSVTVSSTERITLPLVLAGAIGWSLVPCLQLLTGLLLLRGSSHAVERSRALHRYFDTHWPWSLWILTAAALTLVPATRTFAVWILLTAGVPLIWTVRLLFRYCREVLHLPAPLALRRVALHQAATCALALAYVNFAVALWPRVLGWLGWG